MEPARCYLSSDQLNTWGTGQLSPMVRCLGVGGWMELALMWCEQCTMGRGRIKTWVLETSQISLRVIAVLHTGCIIYRSRCINYIPGCTSIISTVLYTP